MPIVTLTVDTKNILATTKEHSHGVGPNILFELYYQLLLTLHALQIALEWPELIRIKCCRVQRVASGAQE